MSDLLDKLNDDEPEATVTVTDTDGVTAEYEFLDIVNLDNTEYAVLCAADSDGFVDIFRIVSSGREEEYERVKDYSILEAVFEIFKIKNEDEFDFD